jgi:hypothetical protein
MGHQVVNQESIHKECEQICASMSKELEDCRDQIKTMRINAGLPMPCRDGMKLYIFEMLDHLFLLQT